jgi:tryptophan-rich sensory protein
MGVTAAALCRWEIERECLPFKKVGRWRPHIKMQSPWGIVYVFMGFASWLVWRQGGFKAHPLPLCLYAALLVAVCLAWPPAFIKGNRVSAGVDVLGKSGTAVVFKKSAVRDQHQTMIGFPW